MKIKIAGGLLTASAREIKAGGGGEARKNICGQSAVEYLWLFLFLVFPAFLRIQLVIF